METYNQRSARKYGWDPSWFGATEFGESLTTKVKLFQQAYGLKPDGLVGQTTYRRAYTNRRAQEGPLVAPRGLQFLQPPLTPNTSPGWLRSSPEGLIAGNKLHPVSWPRVRLYTDPDGLGFEANHRTVLTTQRQAQMLVTHWDACLSSSQCHDVLTRRGLSVHFAIDNDGTIFQFADANDITWHAGNRAWNAQSIGVEISNAYYPKYQSWYIERGYGARPLWENVPVHGQLLPPFLGFYEVQLQAFLALTEWCHRVYGIPLVAPTLNNQFITTVHEPARQGLFHGVLAHYHLTARKIDVAGLDLPRILKHVPTFYGPTER